MWGNIFFNNFLYLISYLIFLFTKGFVANNKLRIITMSFIDKIIGIEKFWTILLTYPKYLNDKIFSSI